LLEAGDLLVPMGEGRFRSDQIHAELGEIYAGTRAGRETAAEITLFKSVGHAIMDAAVARVAYERALQRELGSTVDLGIWPTQVADSGGF
jgi:ornithine cyclodeaminase